MKQPISLGLIRSGALLVVTAILVLLNAASTLALSAEQKRVLDSGIGYFNVTESAACSLSNTTISSNGSNKVYVMGDSLTVGMNASALGTNSLSSILSARGWAATVNAQGCRPLFVENGTLTGGGNCPAGTITDAFTELEKDRSLIAGAGAIVIALGTNNNEGSEEVFRQKAVDYIAALRAANPLIGNRIYWVNTHTRGGGKVERADSIRAVAQQTGIQLIDYRSAALADTTTYSYPENDATHNDSNGYINKAKLIAAALGTPSSPGGGSGGYDPLALRYPNFPDEASVIDKLKNHITTDYPRSPFAANLQYVDQIFETAKRSDRNINPLLVAAIAQQENGYGQANSSATDNNNYFGITQGDGYRRFNSVEEGIDYFVEKVSRHVSNPSGSYTGITNFYEYISVHNTGLIAYPGEYPEGAPGRNEVPPYLTFDPRMNVYTSWDPTRNSHKPGSPMYNPGIYYTNAITLINKVTGFTLSSTPTRGATSAVGGCVNAAGTQATAGANGWDLPGEGPNPMTYYYSQICKLCVPEAFRAGITDFYGPEFPYGHTSIQRAGCGPTSVSMIVSNLTGNKVSAVEMGAWFVEHGYQLPDGGSSTGRFANQGIGSAFEQTFHVTSRRLGSAQGRKLTQQDADLIAAEIRKGNFVVISVTDGPLVSINPETGEQGSHITTIRAVTDDGRFLFADTSDSNSKNRAFGSIIPNGSSRSPLSYEQIGTINVGVFVFERSSNSGL